MDAVGNAHDHIHDVFDDDDGNAVVADFLDQFDGPVQFGEIESLYEKYKSKGTH